MKITNKPLIETADISQGIESRKRRLLNVAAVGLVFLGLYVLLGWAGSFLGSRIPDAWESKLAASTKLFQNSESAGVSTRSEDLLAKLMEGEELRALPYRLFTMEAEGANAFAVPGGGIGITPDLERVATRDIGLAFVLAHELGHHQHRHITQRLGRSLLFGLVSSALFSTSGLDPVENALAIAESGFSREQEREADRFAMELIQRKFGTTDGALEFFEHVDALDEDHLLQKYIGSHPLTSERIAELKNLQTADPVSGH